MNDHVAAVLVFYANDMARGNVNLLDTFEYSNDSIIKFKQNDELFILKQTTK